MPSQKASKRRRQAARTAPPPVRARRQRRASPRVLIAAGVVALLIVVGIVLGVVLTGGSDSSSSDDGVQAPGRRGRPAALRRDPAERQRPRQAERAGDGDRVHRPAVPVLPPVRDRGDADDPRELRAQGQGEGRGARHLVHRARLSDRPGGGARRGEAEQDVQLQPAPVRQPGDGEHGLARRQRHQLGGREHPGPRREPAPERPRLRQRQERSWPRSTRRPTRRASAGRRRSTSCTRAASRSSSR